MTKPENPALFYARSGVAETEDGGEARVVAHFSDITLRDLYIGFAMHGIISSAEDCDTLPTTKETARLACEYADAALAAREES